MSDYATVTDIITLKRNLTSEEQARAQNLIPVICSVIRLKGKEVGKDVDALVADPDYANVVKGVVCDAVMRELNTPGTMLPATSYSEGAGSVSQSYSLPNSSGSIKLWPSDLKTLGFRKQQIGALNLMPNRGC
jgi:hypothetical protein